MSDSVYALVTIEIDLWLLEKEPARFEEASVLAEASRRSPLVQRMPPGMAYVVQVYDHPRRPMRCYEIGVRDAVTGQPVPREEVGA